MTSRIPFRIALVLTLGLILSACGGSGASVEVAAPPTALPAPEIVTLDATPTEAAPTLELTSVPPTLTAAAAVDPALDLNNLPDVPLIVLPGNDWFQPTPPNQLALVSGQVQLFNFSAVWCHYCKEMSPIVHGVRQLYGAYANVVTLDLDLNGPDAYGPFIDALDYDPRFRPGLYILAPDGAVLNRWLGPVDARTLQQALVTAILQFQ